MNKMHRTLTATVFAAAALVFATRMVRATGDKEQEVKAIYKNLIDAENRHDLPADP